MGVIMIGMTLIIIGVRMVDITHTEIVLLGTTTCYARRRRVNLTIKFHRPKL